MTDRMNLAPIFKASQTPLARGNLTASVNDYAQQVIRLLDEWTFNQEEAQILEILAACSPEQFVLLITQLARSEYIEFSNDRHPERSYLHKLYEDINGEEFLALTKLMTAKLIAYKTGSMENFTVTVDKIFAGERVDIINQYLDHDPVKITKVSTWSDGAFFQQALITLQGNLEVKHTKRTLFTVQHHQNTDIVLQPADLAVLRSKYSNSKPKISIACVLEIKNLADKNAQDRWFDTVNIVGIVFGAAAFKAATGGLKQAAIGLFQVALPAAGQFVTDHEKEISEYKYGPEFIFYFRMFDLGMAGFGILKMTSAAGFILLKKLEDLIPQLKLSNTITDIIEGLENVVNELKQAMNNIKSKLSSQNSGNGKLPPPPPPQRPKPAIDPNFPPPPNLPAGGIPLATAGTIEEIVYEINQHLSVRKSIAVYENTADGSLLLVKYPPGTDIANLSISGTYTRSPWILSLRAFSKNPDKANKAFIDEILRQNKSAETKLEVGLYKRELPDGSFEYATRLGLYDQVKPPPGLGWTAMKHYHPDAALQPGFHNPAPADWDLLEVIRQPGSIYQESVVSFNTLDQLVTTEFGFDKTLRKYFIRQQNGQYRFFKELYIKTDKVIWPSSFPPQGGFQQGVKIDLSKILGELDKSGLSDIQMMTVKIDVFKQIDPVINYAGWWVRQFVP